MDAPAQQPTSGHNWHTAEDGTIVVSGPDAVFKGMRFKCRPAPEDYEPVDPPRS